MESTPSCGGPANALEIVARSGLKCPCSRSKVGQSAGVEINLYRGGELGLASAVMGEPPTPATVDRVASRSSWPAAPRMRGRRHAGTLIE
jgi:hypothetical protein